MKHKYHFFFFLLCSLLPAIAAYGKPESFLFGNNPTHIMVNNRVLARVNGKSISVIDVMKKMDLLFLRQYPEYTEVPQARFQFYDVNWRHIMEDLIDKELILADAEEAKIQVSSGDVRQEMENMFGPNIIDNLDKIGLSFDEAYKIVQGDIMIRRMMFARVNTKAMNSVTPQAIRNEYEEFAKKNMRKDTWHYKVISIRNPNAVEGAETAKLAYRLLVDENLMLENLVEKIKEAKTSAKSSVNISEDLFHTESELAEALKQTVCTLESGSYSQPIPQKSRVDNSTVFRLIYLKEKIPGGAVPFSEIEIQLKEQLLDEAVVQETEAYLNRLRLHFDISDEMIKELIPEEFHPFTLL